MAFQIYPDDVKNKRPLSQGLLLSQLTERLVPYLSKEEQLFVLSAYEVALQAHAGQKRESGDEYITHPLAVALILADMKLDAATVATGLLHDVIEDTDISLDFLKESFGDDVSTLVESVSQLSRLQISSDMERQAENFRRLIVAISNDIRVLLVKLADRLHNMRTLHYLQLEQRRKIAVETMDIYVPLAERMGMQEMGDEMDDLALWILEADAVTAIRLQLEEMRRQGVGRIEATIKHLQHILQKHGVICRVEGREKTIHSIWRKLQKKEMALEKLSDIFAFRIIVADEKDCYAALGAIHRAYKMMHGRFKDYISLPKPNGYRSLHTTVVGGHHHPIEIQIKSETMHQEAEHGFAAHGLYKGGLKDAAKRDWLESLLHISSLSSGAEDFLKHTRLEMYRDQVFCFTPRGEIIVLPQGGTPLDFAYAIHSEVGACCMGARINGHEASLGERLKNGDRVEVECGKDRIIHEGWELMAQTGKAQSCIVRSLREQGRDEFMDLGKQLVRRIKEDGTDSIAENELVLFNMKSEEDLWLAVGRGELSLQNIRSHLPSRATIEPMILNGLRIGVAIHYAPCCYPWGEHHMAGMMRRNYGLMMHRLDCPEITPEAIPILWEPDVKDTHHAQLHCSLIHKKGSLAALSRVIVECDGNIINLTSLHKSHDRFHILLTLALRDLAHQSFLMEEINSLDEVLAVSAIVSIDSSRDAKISSP